MKIDIHITNATPRQMLELCEFLNDTHDLEGAEVKQGRKGKWNIPFQSQIRILGKLKGNPDYTKAISICKKWNKPYEEALLLEAGEKTGSCVLEAKTTGTHPADANPVHWKEVIKNSANPPHEPMLAGDSE